MIRVRFFRGGDGAIRGFEIKGHAGYGEPGRDIVCSAVSALAQTAVLGLSDVAGVRPQVVSRDGFFECLLEETMTAGTAYSVDRAQTILETLALGLSDIQKDYGRYISISFFSTAKDSLKGGRKK